MSISYFPPLFSILSPSPCVHFWSSPHSFPPSFTHREPHYDIDVKKLSKKYQQLQKQVHPDQYASKSKVYFCLLNILSFSLSPIESLLRCIFQFHLTLLPFLSPLSQPEFQFSQKHSLLVTTAFSTLKEPSLRAAYLLELCGYKDAGEGFFFFSFFLSFLHSFFSFLSSLSPFPLTTFSPSSLSPSLNSGHTNGATISDVGHGSSRTCR